LLITVHNKKHIHTCMHACTYTYTRTHTHTHIHTHAHTHRRTDIPRPTNTHAFNTVHSNTLSVSTVTTHNTVQRSVVSFFQLTDKFGAVSDSTCSYFVHHPGKSLPSNIYLACLQSNAGQVKPARQVAIL